MLSCYRVVDLTGPEGWLCGLVLAQLGAEVVVVEPPGGYDTSMLRPRWRDAYLRGRVLLEGGPAEVAALAAGADAVIASGAAVDQLADLAAAEPTLVTLAITPWGQSGPKASWRASDLVLCAAGGHVVLNGDADRPPVRVSEPQAYHHASNEAVVHLIAALMERQRSGRGQHIDIAAQQCMLQASQSQMLAAAIGGVAPTRFGGGVRLAGYTVRLVYPALDGHVAVTFLFGDMIGRFTQRLMRWIYDHGHCSAELRDLDYVRFFEFMYSGQLDASLMSAASDAIASYTATKTKAELLQIALEQNLLIAPIATSVDLLAFDQFEARGYWDIDQRPDGQTVRKPGRWALASGTPLRSLPSAGAPGADNAQFPSLTNRARQKAAPPAAQPDDARPLAGLKILDFSWVLAGPLATRLLADLGAEVVRIESTKRPDVIRASGPFMAGQDGVDATALWHNTSAGKRSIELDMSTDGGRQVVLDLARWADAAYESFSAGALQRMGLGYDVLSAVNPRLVLVSTCLLGQTGPKAHFAGFGNLAAALAGFFEITGWPDRPPSGPFTAYTDYVSPRFAAAAILAGVDHARRSGAGQYIDVSQAEATAHLLSPAVLAQQLDGTIASRQGNRDVFLTPHGVFPAGPEGEDRWVAIACHDDAWAALVDCAGLEPSWREWDNATRRAQEATIGAALSAWTAGQDPDALAVLLQSVDVAAHPVSHSAEIVSDPQLLLRGTPVQVPHPHFGRVWVENTQARWSRTQPGPAFAGPPVGHHNQEVLAGILHYDDDRIADLVIEGAIG